jgi:hypothetical protein
VPAGIYRYRGRFVSQTRARQLAQLRGARRYVTIQTAGKAPRRYSYRHRTRPTKEDVAAATKAAIEADRRAIEAAAEARRIAREAREARELAARYAEREARYAEREARYEAQAYEAEAAEEPPEGPTPLEDYEAQAEDFYDWWEEELEIDFDFENDIPYEEAET